MRTPLLALAVVAAVTPARLHADPPPLPAPAAAPTRLFLAPTARIPSPGKGAFGVSEIAFPWAEVGVAPRLSLRVFAVPPLGDLTGAGIVLDPRLQLVRTSGVRAAIGTIQIFGGGETGGVGYGVVTIGGASTAATLGYGYGYGDAVDSGGSPAVVFFGLEHAIGRHVRLVTEAYLGGEALGLPRQTLMGGLRLSRGRWSLDLAAVVPFYETGSGAAGPLVTIARSF